MSVCASLNARKFRPAASEGSEAAFDADALIDPLLALASFADGGAPLGEMAELGQSLRQRGAAWWRARRARDSRNALAAAHAGLSYLSGALAISLETSEALRRPPTKAARVDRSRARRLEKRPRSGARQAGDAGVDLGRQGGATRAADGRQPVSRVESVSSWIWSRSRWWRPRRAGCTRRSSMCCSTRSTRRRWEMDASASRCARAERGCRSRSPTTGRASQRRKFATGCFQPLVSTKNARGGTGLGLSISRAIVRSLGGEMLADNGPLGGAEFTLLLRTAH